MNVELVISEKSKNTDLLHDTAVIEGVTWHSEILQVHCEKMDLPCGEVVFVGVSLISLVKLVFRPNVIFFCCFPLLGTYAFAYSALYQRAQLAPSSASACALA